MQGAEWAGWRRTPSATRWPPAASPSPELVALLHALDAADSDDPALLEVVAGWERVLAWATARQARALEEMTHRVPGSQGEFVADDVAARLGITRRLGQNRVTLALGLAAHPQVADALAVGAVDPRKAEVLLADTEHLPGHVADEVLAGVLGEAPGRTVPQLRAGLREAELARHPAAAAQRHEVARREWCVRMVPAPDAMAWVHAFLPAADAVTVMTGLDALAAPVAAPGAGWPVHSMTRAPRTSAARTRSARCCAGCWTPASAPTARPWWCVSIVGPTCT